jgi:hypothetical protein
MSIALVVYVYRPATAGGPCNQNNAEIRDNSHGGGDECPTAHRGGGRSRALVCRPGLFCFLSPAATRITVSTGLNSSFIRHNSANYGPPPLQQQPPREKITSDASGRLRACRILQRHVGQGWRCCRGPRTHVWRRHVNCVGCLRVPAGNCRWAMQSEQRRNTRQLPRRRR